MTRSKGLQVSGSPNAANSSGLALVLSKAMNHSEHEFYSNILGYAQRHNEKPLDVATISLLKTYAMKVAELYYAFEADKLGSNKVRLSNFLTEHNDFVEKIINDPKTQIKLGLSENRRRHLAKAKFSPQHIERIQELSRDNKLWLEQSDIGRLLFLYFSEESTRKTVMCLARHSFFKRIKIGSSVFIVSNGTLVSYYQMYLDSILDKLHNTQLPVKEATLSNDKKNRVINMNVSESCDTGDKPQNRSA